jgi:predicted Zn-dependent protease
LRLRQAIQDKNWDVADAAVTELEKTMPPATHDQLGPTRVQILLGHANFAAAEKLAQSLSDAHADDAVFLNELAWTLSMAKGLDHSGLALAEKIAERANHASGDKQPPILDTLARAQFMNGKTNEAVATEQKALDGAPDEAKSFYTKFLHAYQQGILPELKE